MSWHEEKYPAGKHGSWEPAAGLFTIDFTQSPAVHSPHTTRRAKGGHYSSDGAPLHECGVPGGLRRRTWQHDTPSPQEQR